MKERTFPSHRARTPASTGEGVSGTSPTNTHAPERAPEERVWSRGERCRTPEERQQKKAYFKTRKLELQRARRTSNPRIDYMPSQVAYERIRDLVEGGLTLSAAIDSLLEAR